MGLRVLEERRRGTKNDEETMIVLELKVSMDRFERGIKTCMGEEEKDSKKYEMSRIGNG